MKTKYLVFGGEVKVNGQRRYVSAKEVAELYGVDVRECYLINDWRETVGQYRTRGLIALYPDESGQYILNIAA